MDFQNYFPIWNKLTASQHERILGSLMERKISKGTVIHNGSMDCTGLLLVKSGQLRAYILSDEGRATAMMFAPSFANRSTIAFPIPEEAPVTTTDFPFSFI